VNRWWTAKCSLSFNIFIVGCTLRYRAADHCKSHMFQILRLIVLIKWCVSYFQRCLQCMPSSMGRESKVRRNLSRTRNLFQSLWTRLWNSLVRLQTPESECTSAPTLGHLTNAGVFRCCQAVQVFPYFTQKERRSKDYAIYGAANRCHDRRKQQQWYRCYSHSNIHSLAKSLISPVKHSFTQSLPHSLISSFGLSSIQACTHVFAHSVLSPLMSVLRHGWPEICGRIWRCSGW